MRYRARLAASLVVAASAALAAQNVPLQPGQTPTFRVDVEYVEVDAVVTDSDGQFVRDLKQDDFQILEDGQPQTISTFALVDIPVERPQRPLTAVDAIEPDVKSNEQPFDGRIYVMVIDDLHTYFGRTNRVRAAARQFIQQHLGANDLMAVVHTAGAADASQEFTGNKRLLLAAVDRTNGRKLSPASIARTEEALRGGNSTARESIAPLADPLDAERQSNARRALDTVRNVAEWFSNVRGRRKSILFVSEGIDYDITNLDPQFTASLIIASTREVLAAAARGNVSIYGVDPRGLTNLDDQAIEVQTFADDAPPVPGAQTMRDELFLAQNSLRQLSEETGGFAVLNANDFTKAFDRIVRDNSSYYAMAYYPPMDAAGKVHRIDVRVRRPGLTVRARRGYVARPTGSSGTNDSRARDANRSTQLMTPELRNAIDTPLPVSGLAMNVFAAPFKGAGPNASVLLAIEMRGRDLRLDPSDRLLVTFAAVDVTGKIRANSVDSIAMKLQPEVRGRVAESGLRVLRRFDLPPGRYQLRVAAHDQGGGNVGSVPYDLTVPDFAKLPFSMSGIALTAASALNQPTVRPDELLREVLPGSPVAARTFPQNDQLALFVEVYDNEPSKPHKVDLTTTVTTDEGKVMLQTEEARDSSELKGRRGGYGYATRLALKDLPPGAYVLTVSARSRLGQTPAVERQIQFRVTAPRAVPSR